MRPEIAESRADGPQNIGNRAGKKHVRVSEKINGMWGGKVWQ